MWDGDGNCRQRRKREKKNKNKVLWIWVTNNPKTDFTDFIVIFFVFSSSMLFSLIVLRTAAAAADVLPWEKAIDTVETATRKRERKKKQLQKLTWWWCVGLYDPAKEQSVTSRFISYYMMMCSTAPVRRRSLNIASSDEREKKHEKFPTGRESSRDDGRGKKDESSSRLRVKEKVIHIQNLYS